MPEFNTFSEKTWEQIVAQFNADSALDKQFGVFCLTESKTVKYFPLYPLPEGIFGAGGSFDVYGTQFQEPVFVLGAVYNSKLIKASNPAFNVHRFRPKESFYMLNQWFDPDFKCIEQGDYRREGSCFAIDSSYS